MPTQNVAILVNCHRVTIHHTLVPGGTIDLGAVTSRDLVKWLAGIIRSAEPGLIVQADLAAAVIDIAPADGDSVLNVGAGR